MLVPGTEMHFVTFGFICAEIVILFYLLIHWLARRDDKASYLNIILIILLLLYNVTGGLLPDPKMPGSFFVQECIAYGTGFIAPCYFPYFVYKGFGLEKMRFHAYRGVFYFLIAPYLLFIAVFALSNLKTAQNILVIPVLYALWVLLSLYHAIRFKYQHGLRGKQAKEEIAVLFLSLTPWLGLPIITYFDLGQPIEAVTTNTGFLLLLALHLKRNVQQLKEEHQRLIKSEMYLRTWNERLKEEVEKRTRELERMSTEQRILENCENYQLTNREKEIVRFICRGHTYKQIAENLYISERTVAKHMQNVFEKVRVSNRVELSTKLGALIEYSSTLSSNKK
jgi:DNA-binding CsgD family transcriptional regulator